MHAWKHPATIIAMLALFVALGSGAVAAVAINGSQIKNHTIAAKKLTASAVNSLHAIPGAAYEVEQNGQTTTLGEGAVYTLTLPNLPAGSYAIYGEGSIDPFETNDTSSGCVLTAGADTDATYLPLSQTDTWITPIHTELTHTFTSTGTVTMACTVFMDTWALGGSHSSGNSEIIAVRVGAVHRMAAVAAASKRPTAAHPANGLSVR